MRIGIRVKVLISFLAVTVFVSLLSSMLMYLRYRAMMLSEAKNDVIITKEITSELNDLTLLIEKGGNYISFDKGISEALHTDVEDGIKRAVNLNIFSDEFKKTYDLLLDNKFGNYFLSFYINPNLPVAQYVGDGKKTLWGYDIYNIYNINATDEWCKKTIEKDGAIYIFRSEIPNDTYIYIAKLIKNRTKGDKANEDYLGISLVGIEGKQILKRLNKLKITDSMQFAVIDNYKNVICKSSDTYSNEFIIDKLNTNLPIAGTTAVYEDDALLINTDKTDMGIYLMSIMSLDDIYLTTREIRNVLFLSILISVILAILMSLILSGNLTKPIVFLSETMKKAKEKRELSVDSITNDEVGDLYKAFNKLIKDLDEKSRKAKELELKMFQLQINPHFLYNTLDSISWKAISNNQTEIVDMIEGLSEIFKYSVKNNEQFATLSEETEIAKKYVQLQKSRVARVIDFKCYLSPDVTDVMVPKCILQPLVENSILHAENGADSSLMIEIIAYKEKNNIFIKVKDNGTDVAINKLNEYLDGNEELYPNGEMGIRNVNTRIKLKYGNSSHLYYEKNEKGETAAVIVINENEKYKQKSR